MNLIRKKKENGREEKEERKKERREEKEKREGKVFSLEIRSNNQARRLGIGMRKM